MSDSVFTMEQLFAAIAGQYPDAIAVSKGDRELTYRQLDRWAGQAGGALAPLVASSEAPVALLFGHEISGIVGVLAVLKAGRPYAYLAEEGPDEDKANILRDLDCRVLLTDTAHHRQALRLGQEQGMAVLDLQRLPAETPALARQAGGHIDQIAAVYFTSGSSGRPKGVIRTHRTLLSRFQVDRSIYPVGRGDHLPLLSRLNYTTSCALLYNALCSGATLHMADPREMRAIDLAHWLVEKGITYLRAHTTLLRRLLDAVDDSFYFAELRCCRPSGRLLRRDVQRLWRHLPPGCRLGHALASTESSLVTHFFLAQGELPDGDVVPVGRPVDGVTISLLGPDGRAVPAGDVGEIVVSSAMVTPGYWRDESLSARKIKVDPTAPHCRTIATGDLGRWRADGLLEYVGRKDNQVKVRGYRIELEAVEALLEQMPGVGMAAARAAASGNGDRYLIAYVVPQKGKQFSTAVLRRQLAAQAPEYMVPARVIELPELPLGATGKVDRAALPNPDRLRPELGVPYAAPRTETERQLAAIWSDLLEIDNIGVDDTFFDLGGQSLLAAGVASRVNAAFSVDLPLKVLFEAATIAALAPSIDVLAADFDQMSADELTAKINLLGI